MSDNDHGTGSAAPAHGTGHDDGHGHDEHGQADTLDGIDWTMWSVGVLGVLVALVVTAGFVAATGFNFGA